jgi:hypothetical protein
MSILDIQGWSVSVEVDAETILTMGHNSVSGIDDFTEAQAQVIRNCAEHLLAFIGSPRSTPSAPAVDGARGELPPLPDPIEIDWPTLNSSALGCGVEDRNIRDRYDAAEYGWQDGVDKAAECVPEQLFTAEQMREYARAALSVKGATNA